MVSGKIIKTTHYLVKQSVHGQFMNKQGNVVVPLLLLIMVKF